jgi:integrase
LVLLDGALGTRRGELAALRWQDCDFENDTFQIEHSCYWRRGGILRSMKTEASAKPLPMHPALKQALLEWKAQSHRTQATDFVFPSRLSGARKALDLAAVLKRKIRPTFDKLGITEVGWHTFRHTVGTVLAEFGRASVDDPRLLASLESQRDQQVFTSGIEYEEKRPSQTGCGHSSSAFAARRENRRNGCTLIAPRFQKCQIATA